MEGLTIRLFALGDVKSVVAITQASVEAAQWATADFERLALEEADASGTRAWVAVHSGAIAGFIVMRVAGDEVEILNIAISFAQRRKGVATRLIENALAIASAAGARRGFLEVRESNGGAIALYERCGFQPVGRRENYYTGPTEAAVVLAKSLAPV